MKTLGQIANEAFDAVDGRLFTESWEAAAQAVRAAVIEECAQLVSGFNDEQSKALACGLRVLKDKP